MNQFRTNNFVRAVVWVSFAAIMYLILADIVRPWIDLPSFDNIGYTLVFVCFALIHCLAAEGLRRTAIFFFWTALISYLFEETGVRTGLIYGPYHYSMSLGPKLGHVPVRISLAWFMMIYPSWIVARAILRRVDKNSLAGIIALAVVAAMVMTAWDAVMDPGMSAAGNWIWETGGSYFGVPLRNYFGWMVTTFIVYVGAGFFSRFNATCSFATEPLA